MEPIYSNSCKYTMENLMESSVATMPKWYKPYCYAFCAVFLALAVYGFVKGSLMGILFLIFAAVIMVVYWRKTVASARTVYKHNMEKYGQETETRIFFYDDSIVGKNLQSGSAVTTEYDKVQSIIETKNLFILKMSINMVILVDKNGFIGNNGADFADFIKGKCPNARKK